MAITVSQRFMDELAEALKEACEKGDNVSAISRRCGIARETISTIKNSSYKCSPSLKTAAAVAQAIGLRIVIERESSE